MRLAHSSSSRLGVALVVAAAAAAWGRASAQSPAESLLTPAVLKALDQELSGNTARDHVSRLTQFHRVPASPGFHQAIDYIMTNARAYGLSDVHVETFPGDGKTYFGTLLGNRGWRVDGGELLEVSPIPRRIISQDDVRVAVADNSESADVTAELVDVGRGTSARDYEGRTVKGKLVLSDGNPGSVHRLAVEERGAAGLVSYTSNQVSGWWRDDPDLVRWGHLDARGRANTFAMMISVGEAKRLQQRLQRGETITLRAIVQARNDDSSPYETLMATIPGTDPAAGEIVFSCHLDHEKPGANDNASGCAANLEIARTLKTLMDAKRLAAPRRTIRFVWPSEMTGTIAYLTKYPELAGRIRAAIHLDMVGGDPFITKSILHVTRSPWSAASATDDVAEIFGHYVIDGAYRGAATGDASQAIRAGGGSKDSFWADFTPYETGSDHWIYQEGSFAIPTIYLRDSPDIYIHTNKDLPDNIEPTKIKRSAFIAAASGYYLATLPDGLNDTLLSFVMAGANARLAEDGRRTLARMQRGQPPDRDVLNVLAQAIDREQRRVKSLSRFFADGRPDAASQQRLDESALKLAGIWNTLGLTAPRPAGTPPTSADRRVPARVKDVKGPLGPTTDWVEEKAGRAAAELTIARLPNSDDVCYEIVNFVDGVRTVSEIRDAVSAEFEPVTLAAVSEYFDLLARIGAVSVK